MITKPIASLLERLQDTKSMCQTSRSSHMLYYTSSILHIKWIIQIFVFFLLLRICSLHHFKIAEINLACFRLWQRLLWEVKGQQERSEFTTLTCCTFPFLGPVYSCLCLHLEGVCQLAQPQKMFRPEINKNTRYTDVNFHFNTTVYETTVLFWPLAQCRMYLYQFQHCRGPLCTFWLRE